MMANGPESFELQPPPGACVNNRERSASSARSGLELMTTLESKADRERVQLCEDGTNRIKEKGDE